MPRRQRASYRVQKKYKRARYMSGSDKLDESGSDTSKLNEAFLESDNSLNIHDSTDVLNEGFFLKLTLQSAKLNILTKNAKPSLKW